MRALTVMEMDAVSGGNGKSLIQNIGQCTVDTGIGAAAGAAIGGLVGGAVVAIAASLASDACNALPKRWWW